MDLKVLNCIRCKQGHEVLLCKWQHIATMWTISTSSTFEKELTNAQRKVSETQFERENEQQNLQQKPNSRCYS